MFKSSAFLFPLFFSSFMIPLKRDAWHSAPLLLPQYPTVLHFLPSLFLLSFSFHFLLGDVMGATPILSLPTFNPQRRCGPLLYAKVYSLMHWRRATSSFLFHFRLRTKGLRTLLFSFSLSWTRGKRAESRCYSVLAAPPSRQNP